MTTFDVIDVSTLSPVDPAEGYAALVNDGIIARSAMDTGRWILGGNVRKLTTYYRERTVEQYADDIGGVEATSLYEYAGMASFYPLKIREELSELNLCYSHYREARRLKNLEQAIEFLKEIALNHWTTNDARKALKAMQRDGVNVSDTYSGSSPVTTLDNKRVNPRPVYEWRGPASVTIDANGDVRLRCDGVPAIDPEKRYMVSFEEY